MRTLSCIRSDADEAPALLAGAQLCEYLYRKGAVDQATRLCEDALANAPGTLWALKALGRIFLKTGRDQEVSTTCNCCELWELASSFVPAIECQMLCNPEIPRLLGRIAPHVEALHPCAGHIGAPGYFEIGQQGRRRMGDPWSCLSRAWKAYSSYQGKHMQNPGKGCSGESLPSDRGTKSHEKSTCRSLNRPHGSDQTSSMLLYKLALST